MGSSERTANSSMVEGARRVLLVLVTIALTVTCLLMEILRKLSQASAAQFASLQLGARGVPGGAAYKFAYSDFHFWEPDEVVCKPLCMILVSTQKHDSTSKPRLGNHKIHCTSIQ